MSKGSQPATQTQNVQIPDEFKAWVFGPGMYGGSQGSGGSGSSGAQKAASKGLFGLVPKLFSSGGSSSPATKPQFMTAGFEGILPMGLKLAKDGLLSPTNMKSETTGQAQQSSRDLIDQLNNEFLPNVQGIFDRVGNRDLVNSQQTQDVIAASTRPIQEQLMRYAIPSTQDSAIAAGQLGSSRQGIAEGLARSDANNQMGDIASRIAFGALQEQLAGERMALQFSPQLMQMMGMPTTLLSELGQNEEYYDLESRSGQSRNLQSLAALLQGFIPGANTSTTSQAQRTGNEKLGGALSGAAMGSQIMPGWGTAIGGLIGAMAG